jgi:hypothetical protein
MAAGSRRLRKGQQDHDGDEERKLVAEDAGEVDIGRRFPADMDDEAGAVLGSGDELVSQTVDQVDSLGSLGAGGRIDGGHDDVAVG